MEISFKLFLEGTKELITVDFDSTLKYPIDFDYPYDLQGKPNNETIKFIKDNELNYDFAILTSRSGTSKDKEEINKFLKENGLDKIFKKMYFTQGKLKADFLKAHQDIKPLLHLDDESTELVALEKAGFKTKNMLNQQAEQQFLDSIRKNS